MRTAMYFLIALVIVLLIAPVLMPAQYQLVRSIEINAPVSTVFPRLTDLNEFVKWNPFSESDPTSKTEVAGTGVGSTMTYSGEKSGEGKMTIVNIVQDKSVDVRMDFIKPMPGEAMAHWIVAASSDNATTLTWSYEQKLPYFKRYLGIMMDFMMSPIFDKGLQNFKSLVESAK
ncbi:SRPBCC family protein [Bdellovibrio bacteriovorus]|nr:SRPBCC family protein [Bdellovibrio bacteriovorus]